MVKPLTARAGYVTFIEYVAGSNKGGVKQGDVFNSVFSLGEMDENRVNYTGAPVVEAVKAGDEIKCAWTPIDGKIEFSADKVNWTEITEGAAAEADGFIRYQYDNIVIPQHDIPVLNARTREIPLVAKARRISIKLCGIHNNFPFLYC